MSEESELDEGVTCGVAPPVDFTIHIYQQVVIPKDSWSYLTGLKDGIHKVIAQLTEIDLIVQREDVFHHVKATFFREKAQNETEKAVSVIARSQRLVRVKPRLSSFTLINELVGVGEG